MRVPGPEAVVDTPPIGPYTKDKGLCRGKVLYSALINKAHLHRRYSLLFDTTSLQLHYERKAC